MCRQHATEELLRYFQTSDNHDHSSDDIDDDDKEKGDESITERET